MYRTLINIVMLNLALSMLACKGIDSFNTINSDFSVREKNVTDAKSLKGYIVNIENAALENSLFRKVLYTAKNSQLVLMSIPPDEDIGEETHKLDQFIRVEAGTGEAIINGVRHAISDGFGIVIPAGALHNIVNMSNKKELKLYTIYSPPEHKDGMVHKTKADAEKEEHFDGITTE